MSLPPSAPSSGPLTVELSGGTVEVVRGLTWGELQRIKSMGEGLEADAFTIACGTGLDVPEVRQWVNTALAGDVEKVIQAIFTLSRAGEKARFRD